MFDKKDHTPVTAADRGAEKVMREWIEAHFPTHGIFGEEFGIKEASGDSFPRYRWILIRSTALARLSIMPSISVR